MGTLNGKVALVTGASRGIGRAVAERLASEGAAVVVNCSRDVDEAERVAAGIRAAGGEAEVVQADLARVADIRRLMDTAAQRFGRLDIVVANAGACTFKPFIEITEDEFDHLFAVNARGAFFCIQEALRHLGEGGRIVCISTIGTVLNGAGGAAYFGSKAAIEQFCRTAAREVAGRGITVNVVSPGFVDTSMLRDMLAVSPAGTGDDILGMTPLGRFGAPADIAGAVAWLAGPDAGWVTRQNVAVDGGIVAR